MWCAHEMKIKKLNYRVWSFKQKQAADGGCKQRASRNYMHSGHIFCRRDFPQLQLFMVKHKSVVGCLESRHVHARALSHKSVAARRLHEKEPGSLCAAVLSSLLVLRRTRANFANEDLGLVGGWLLTRALASNASPIGRDGLEARHFIVRRLGSARVEPDFPNPHFLFYFWRQQSLRRRLRIIWRRPLSLRESQIMRL